MPSRSLSANRDFRVFWLGQATSTAGDAFAFVAMPLLVLQMTGSVAQMGYVTALACAGQIVMSLFSGLIIDRAHRRYVMIGADLGRMVLYGALSIGSILGLQSLALIYLVAGLGSALGNLFIVGHVTALANLVETDDFARANGRMQATQAATYAIGPVMAGALSARVGPSVALAVDAASFGVSALSLVIVRFRNEIADRHSDAHGGGPVTEILTGIHYLAGEPLLRTLTILMVFVGLLASAGLSAAVIDLIVYRLRNELGRSGDVVGTGLGIAAAGALLGALASPHVKRRLGFGACFLGGTAIQGLGLVGAGLSSGVILTVFGGWLWAAGLTLRAVAAVSLRQEITPDALLGRVTAASWMMVFGAATFGALLVTRLAAFTSTSMALRVTGVLLIVVAAAGTITPVNLRISTIAR